MGQPVCRECGAKITSRIGYCDDCGAYNGHADRWWENRRLPADVTPPTDKEGKRACAECMSPMVRSAESRCWSARAVTTTR